MNKLAPIEPVDYLLIGHVTKDITPTGYLLGGTASYASLSAKALGLRVGIVTACAADFSLPELNGIQISSFSGDGTTTFENIQTPTGRIQYCHHVAPVLTLNMVPESWRQAPIVHLGPIAREVDPNLARAFPNSIVGLTLQGWLRDWDSKGRVHFSDWMEARYVLENSQVAILSIEDVERNETRIDEIVSAIRLLVVTEGANGCRVYWNGDLRHFPAPTKVEFDPTGAGDIFAAAFFIRYKNTRDPWEAARFATLLASNSVTRRGLLSIPTPEEIQASLIEVIEPG